MTEELSSHPLIKDSKVLTPEQREEAFSWIQLHCTYGFGIGEADIVDGQGILEATEQAMHEALTDIEKQITPTYLLVDGRDKFWFDYPHSSIIDGDEKEPCISAASIVAKVMRDHIMMRCAKQYPKYGFEQHKGYATPQHIVALREHGPCELHRRTFLKNIIGEGAFSG